MKKLKIIGIGLLLTATTGFGVLNTALNLKSLHKKTRAQLNAVKSVRKVKHAGMYQQTANVSQTAGLCL
jgi:hypothetical protein